MRIVAKHTYGSKGKRLHKLKVLERIIYASFEKKLAVVS